MSILIKGMDMPKDGEAVVLVISNENGKMLAEVDEYCGAVYEAVPIPPHGNLIDRDAYEYPGDLMDEPVVIPAEEGDA